MYFVLCFPFISTLGVSLFRNNGKGYYVIASAFAIIMIVSKQLKKRWLKVSDTSKLLKYMPAIFGLGIAIVYVWLKYAFSHDNILFIFVCLAMLLFFYNFYSERSLTGVGICAGVIILLFIAEIWLNRMQQYFNPNSYAMVVTVNYVIFISYLQQFKRNFKNKIAIIAFTAMALYEVYYFGSETQMLSIAFFFVSSFIYYLIANKPRYKTILTIVAFSLLLLLPVVCLQMIRYGILPITLFSGRGYRWKNAFDVIKSNGLVGVVEVYMDPHNSFLDFSLRYSLLFSIVFFAILFVVCRMLAKKGKTIKYDYYILSLLTIIVMNLAESLLTSLTNAYFFYIILGFTVAEYKSIGEQP